jgi:hypothetical protein
LLLLLFVRSDASAATRGRIKKDQLNVIFDVIGTPKEEDLCKARTEEVCLSD